MERVKCPVGLVVTDVYLLPKQSKHEVFATFELGFVTRLLILPPWFQLYRGPVSGRHESPACPPWHMESLCLLCCSPYSSVLPAFCMWLPFLRQLPFFSFIADPSLSRKEDMLEKKIMLCLVSSLQTYLQPTDALLQTGQVFMGACRQSHIDTFETTGNGLPGLLRMTNEISRRADVGFSPKPESFAMFSF